MLHRIAFDVKSVLGAAKGWHTHEDLGKPQTFTIKSWDEFRKTKLYFLDHDSQTVGAISKLISSYVHM